MKLKNKIKNFFKVLSWLIIIILIVGTLYYVWTLEKSTEKIITKNYFNETLIENPYDDSLIFSEIKNIQKEEQENYLMLLKKIESLEIKLNFSEKRIKDLEFKHQIKVTETEETYDDEGLIIIQ